MKPAGFEYVAAHSLAEALEALGRDEDAKPIAGGQSLVPALNMRLVRPTLLVDLNRAGLDRIEVNGAVEIGATVRQGALERDLRTHPLLREALPYVGHFVTRNRGTVGGSIAHADGSAEIPLCLAALDGTVVVEGAGGRRDDRTGRIFCHALSGRRLHRGSSSLRARGRIRRRTRAPHSRSSHSAPATTRSRWWPLSYARSTVSPGTFAFASVPSPIAQRRSPRWRRSSAVVP